MLHKKGYSKICTNFVYASRTEDNANLVEPRYSTFGAKYGTGYNHNNHSSSSSNGTPPSILKKSNSRGGKNSEKREPGDGYEARNDEVIRRVAEMQSILRSTEQYLTDTDAESTMTEKSATGSERSASAYGKLRHSDSLLALAAQEWILKCFMNLLIFNNAM